MMRKIPRQFSRHQKCWVIFSRQHSNSIGKELQHFTDLAANYFIVRSLTSAFFQPVGELPPSVECQYWPLPNDVRFDTHTCTFSPGNDIVLLKYPSPPLIVLFFDKQQYINCYSLKPTGWEAASSTLQLCLREFLNMPDIALFKSANPFLAPNPKWPRWSTKKNYSKRQM